MDNQTLEKLAFNLKILPVTDKGIPNGLPFLAMFNPESFAIKEDMNYDAKCAPANTGSDPIYKGRKARTFSIAFTLDGTGVNIQGVKIPVTAQIALFRATTTHIIGKTHQPHYLIVQYGTFIIMCRMLSSTVNYTMFDMFGLPIRAKVTANFVERTPNTFGDVMAMLSSPDLTHSIKVKEGDLLPLLTKDVYKNQDYEIQVARANKLHNFRKLEAGSTLIFPPIAVE
ncbi:hypothetical protein NQT66_06855 [Cellulophaga baltica]|uniref:CIS tube protein n=1 Tax=Cellulophaga baltica TaxID=76594 RepID=UPI002148C4C5|nr:hypothetical protein [Cellulophaga baltica]MCR1024523.1 hypothetical protein [Cellulophaga baltica]